MKLATLADGTRDGRLVLVSRDLAYATDARGIAKTFQDALDDWAHLAPKLETLATPRCLRSFGLIPCFIRADRMLCFPRGSR